MSSSINFWVGLDVHQDSITAAVFQDRERQRASGTRAVMRNRRSQPSIALSPKGSHLGSIVAIGGYSQP